MIGSCPASGVRRPAFCALSLLLTSGMVTADRPPVYEMVDLGQLGFAHDPSGRFWDTSPSVPGTFDVNDRDQVAYARAVPDGASGTHVRPFLFLLREDGQLAAGVHDALSVFGSATAATVGAALDINNDRVIVGQVDGTTFFEGHAHAWIVDEANPAQTVTVLLPKPPDRTWSRAVSISESAPWTIVCQTGAVKPCPNLCERGEGASLPHLESYIVTMDAAGNCTSPVLFVGDGDCEAAVGVWNVAGDALEYVGADLRISDGECADDTPQGCGTDESALRWSSPGTLPAALEDFDSTSGPDIKPSEGRDVGADGSAVGYGIEIGLGGLCNDRALLWELGGSSKTILHDALLNADDDDEIPGLDPVLGISAAEGRNDAATITVAGWDEFTGRGALWYWESSPPAGGTWRVMFPGVSFPYSPDTVVLGACLDGSGSDAEVRFLYDVNVRQAAVGRADIAGNAMNESELHLVLLVPRESGCGSGDGDVTPDINRDGLVDFQDVLEVLAAWGPCANCAFCPTDLDADRDTSFMDLLSVLSAWSMDCVTFTGPPESVQDCWDRFGQDLAAFEACVESLNTSN